MPVLTANAIIRPEFLTYQFNSLFATVPLRLGIIPSGSEVSLSASPATLYAAENTAGLTSRPTLNLIPANADFDLNGNLQIDQAIEFVINPTSQIIYRQLFVIRGGLATFGDDSGVLICIGDYGAGNEITAPASVDTTVKIPWRLLIDPFGGAVP